MSRNLIPRPKGRQYPNVYRHAHKRTNWEGAGPDSAYATFYPSDSPDGATIEMQDGRKYIMQSNSLWRVRV